ncbi:MAG: hypothetical protein WC091_06000 [Sulfuricellaceae bacterium]
MGAAFQVGCDFWCIIIGHQLGLGDRLALTDSSGWDVFKLIAERRAASCPKPLTHVLSHASQSLFTGHKAVNLIHRVQHGGENNSSDAIEFRCFGKHNLNATLTAFMHEAVGDVLIAGEA